MGFDLSSALKNAKEATGDFIAKNKEKKQARSAASQAQAEAEAETARLRADHNAFLALVASKVTGSSATDISPPLVACDANDFEYAENDYDRALLLLTNGDGGDRGDGGNDRGFDNNLGPSSSSRSAAQIPVFGPPPDSRGGDAGNPYLNSSASFYHRQIMRATAAASSSSSAAAAHLRNHHHHRRHRSTSPSSNADAAPAPALPPRPRSALQRPRHTKAVFFVTTPIEFGPIELSRGSYNLLAKHVGMSLNSVSHWLLCVVDRCYFPPTPPLPPRSPNNNNRSDPYSSSSNYYPYNNPPSSYFIPQPTYINDNNGGVGFPPQPSYIDNHVYNYNYNNPEHKPPNSNSSNISSSIPGGNSSSKDNDNSSGSTSKSYCYDLMSDHLSPLASLGKSYLRVYEATPEFVSKSWSYCYYVGETTKTHAQIQDLGQDQVALNPRYNLVSNNCQDLAEALVRQICDVDGGKMISQAKLGEELALASPKIAMDLMVARLRTRMDSLEQKEDHQEVQEDMAVIKGLWHKVQHQGQGHQK